MQVAVHLRADAAAKFDLQNGIDAVSQMLRNVAAELGVELRSLPIKGNGPAQDKLRGLLMIRVPNEETGLRVVERMRGLPVIDSAYLKPDAAPAGVTRSAPVKF